MKIKLFKYNFGNAKNNLYCLEINLRQIRLTKELDYKLSLYRMFFQKSNFKKA